MRHLGREDIFLFLRKVAKSIILLLHVFYTLSFHFPVTFFSESSSYQVGVEVIGGALGERSCPFNMKRGFPSGK